MHLFAPWYTCSASSFYAAKLQRQQNLRCQGMKCPGGTEEKRGGGEVVRNRCNPRLLYRKKVQRSWAHAVSLQPLRYLRLVKRWQHRRYANPRSPQDTTPSFSTLWNAPFIYDNDVQSSIGKKRRVQRRDCVCLCTVGALEMVWSNTAIPFFLHLLRTEAISEIHPFQGTL